MSFHRLFLAAAAAVSLTAPAMAQDLQPIQSQIIDLGSVAGDAYYTVQPDGFHVVATFGQRNGGGTPVRFQAVLTAGQSVVFSSPRNVGELPATVQFSRQNDRLLVRKAIVVN